MFAATLSDAQVFRDSIDTISQIIDEATFRLGKDGISLIASDRAVVAVVEFKLSSGAFQSYECDGETSISLNLNNLLTALRRAGSDKVTLKLGDKPNRLEVLVEGSSRRSLHIPLLDLSSEELPQIGQLKFPATVALKTEVVGDGVADAEIVADSVILEASDSSFGMRAESESRRSELKIEKGSEGLVEIKSSGAKSRYPLDYLKKFMKASKLAENAKISFGNDYPMKIELQGDNVYLSMVVAPRVSED